MDSNLHTTNKTNMASLSLIVVAIAVAGVYAGLTMSSRTSTGAPLLQSIDPCEHLTGEINDPYNDLILMAIEDIPFLSHSVARVEVSSIESPRFNTPGGEPPTPLPTTATEEEENDYSVMVFSPVVLDATHIYSGTEVTGYVVIRVGGTTAACPDHEVTTSDCFVANEGDDGLAELKGFSPEFVAINPPWYQHLVAIADELNENPNVHYEPALLFNWYRYSGAMAESWSLGTPVAISTLEAIIEGALP